MCVVGGVALGLNICLRSGNRVGYLSETGLRDLLCVRPGFLACLGYQGKEGRKCIPAASHQRLVSIDRRIGFRYRESDRTYHQQRKAVLLITLCLHVILPEIPVRTSPRTAVYGSLSGYASVFRELLLGCYLSYISCFCSFYFLSQ